MLRQLHPFLLPKVGLHSPGTQAGQQHQSLQEPPFLLPSQASRGRHRAPVCREHPARPKGHSGTLKRSAGEGSAGGSGALSLQPFGHHGGCKVPPAPSGYWCPIAAGTGEHCCPRTRLVTTQLPRQGSGHSLPHDQPRDEAASSVGTCFSSHQTPPNFSL